METIADLKKWIRIMRSELEQQKDAFDELAGIFAEGNVQLIRHDQVTLLRNLKTRILAEVESIKGVESAAQIGSTKGILLGGTAVFTLGSLFAAVKGRKDALNIGVKMAGDILSKKVPFGTVLITIGGKGLPEDLKIIPVSRLARESSKSESEVIANIRNNGDLILTPETFTDILDKVERGIADGSYSLPIGIDELTKQLPDNYEC